MRNKLHILTSLHHPKVTLKR